MYDISDPIPLGVEVRDSAGALADPGALAVTITLPDGSTLTGGWTAAATSGVVGITRASAGSFQAAYTAAQAGLHAVRWVATGANACAYSDTFVVAGAADIPAVSLDDLRAHLGSGTRAQDELLRQIALVSTELAEDHTGRYYRRRTFTETHAGGKPVVRLLASPVQSVTSVVVDGTPVTDWTLEASAGLLWRDASGTETWPPGPGAVVVTFVAGYSAPPAKARQGILEIARHLWDTQRGGAQLPRQAGASDGWDPRAGFSLPRRAAELLDGDNAPGFA